MKEREGRREAERKERKERSNRDASHSLAVRTDRRANGKE